MVLLKEMVLQAVLILLWGGSIVGLLVGVGLLLKPEQLAALNQYFSRWVGAGKLVEPLDRPRATERYFYRHHKLTGSVLVLGSIFILYTFLIRYNVRRLSAAIESGTWFLVDALAAILIVGGVVALVIGIVVLVRPSLLRDIEKAANQWVETGGIARFFNRMRFSPDNHVLRHRKVAGAVLIVGSVYILITIGPFIWQGGLRW